MHGSLVFDSTKPGQLKLLQ